MRRYRWLVFAFAFAFAFELVATPAYGFDTTYQACFNPSGGWGVPAPVIDGLLTNESGWARTFQYRFQNGVAMPDANVKLLATSAGSKLYVAVEVRNDTSYDALDMVLLAFQSGSTWYRVIVHPFPNTAVPTGVPFKVYYDKSTVLSGGLVHFGGTPTAVTPTDPSPESTADDPADGKFRVWTTASGISGGVGSWTTEIAIPLGMGATQLPLPSGTDIGMYVAISRTNASPAAAAYYSWPISLWSTTSGGTLDLDHDLPNPANWGVARIGSAATCNGLSVTGLRTLDPDNMANGSLLARTKDNAFRLTVKNTGTDNIAGVTAKFSVGLWGVPLSWRNVASSPSAGSTVNAGATVSLDSGYTYNPTTPINDLVNDHVCLLGEVETTQGNTTITQKSIIINTQWGPASSFTGHPIIQSSKLKPEGGGATNTLVLQHLAKRQYAYSTGEIAGQDLGVLTAQLDWQFDVSHLSGRTLVVEGVKQPVYTPIGSFVEIVRHPLPSSFSDGFAERHQQQRRRALAEVTEIMGSEADPVEIQRAVLLALNALLADDAEKPPATDFTLAVKGMAAVGNTGNFFQTEVAVGKDVSLETIATHNTGGGGGGGGGGCCPAPAGGATTPSKVGTLGLVLLVGAVVYRRRRRP